MVTTLPPNKSFELRRQEQIVASLINYISGHTSKISDFNEGSIIRSVVEGIGQELFRQNVTFAQQVSEAIRESVRNAFGLPYQTKSKAYGSVTFYRKMLDGPSSVLVGTYSNTLGRLASTVLSGATAVSAVSGENGLSAGVTYYYAACPLFCGEGLKVTPTGATVTGVTVDALNSSGYGYKTGDIMYVDGGNHQAKIQVTVDSATHLVTSATVVSGGSGYPTNNPLSATIESPVHSAGAGSNILSATTEAGKTCITIKVANVIGAGRFLIFRSTNKYMLNSTCWQVRNPFSVSTKATRETTGTFTIRDNGIGTQSGLTVVSTGTGAYTVSSGAITSLTISTAGNGYKDGTLFNVNAVDSTNTTPAKVRIFTKNNIGYTSSVLDSQGQVDTLIIESGGTGFTTGKVLSFTVADDNNVPFPGSVWSWVVTANNFVNKVLSKGTPSFYDLSPIVTKNETEAIIQWTSVSASDKLAVPVSYSVWRTTLGLRKNIPQDFMVESVTTSAMTGGLDNGTYWYSMSAIYSDADESVPTDPVSFQVIANSYERNVKISWYAMNDAIGYRIYRSTSSDMSENLYCIDVENYNQDHFIDKGITFSSGIIPRRWPRIATVNASVTTQKDSQWIQEDIGYGGSIGVSYYNKDGTSFSDAYPANPTAPAVAGPIIIGAGTRVQVPATTKTYEVVNQTILVEGRNTMDIMVVATEPGTRGNTDSGTIIKLTSPIYGIDMVKNEHKFTNGKDQETEEEWRNRFSNILNSLSRGTSSSIEAGALTTQILDSSNMVSEYVTRAIVRDFGQNEVIVNIHNGTESGSSQALVNKCQKIINGYVDDSGYLQAGYKPAGIPVIVYAANVVPQNIYINFSVYAGISPENLRKTVEKTVYDYFDTLDISDGLLAPSIYGYANDTGSSMYQYMVISIDSIGGRSLPSNILVVPNGSELPNNTIKWNQAVTETGYPEIVFYEIIRKDDNATQWLLVEKIDASTGLSNGVITYTDKSVSTDPYIFVPPVRKMMQKSELIQKVMSVPGVASAKIFFDPISRYIINTDRLGTGLLLNVTLDNTSGVVASVSIPSSPSNSGGIRYKVGDILTILGHDAIAGRPAIVMVSAVNEITQAVTAVRLVSQGAGYTTISNPVSVAWLVPDEPEYVIPSPGSILVPGTISVQ